MLTRPPFPLRLAGSAALVHLLAAGTLATPLRAMLTDAGDGAAPAAPAHAATSLVWDTPFRWGLKNEGYRVKALALDPCAPIPSLVVVAYREWNASGYLFRLGIDGSRNELFNRPVFECDDDGEVREETRFDWEFCGLAAAANGDFWVNDGKAVLRLDRTGNLLRRIDLPDAPRAGHALLGAGPAAGAGFYPGYSPIPGIALLPDGSAAAWAEEASAIYRIPPDGDPEHLADTVRCSQLAATRDGKLIFTDGSAIRCWSPGAGITTLTGTHDAKPYNGDQKNARDGVLSWPAAVTVTDRNEVVFTDWDRIRQITADGRLVTLAGDYRLATEEAAVSHPESLCPGARARFRNPCLLAAGPGGGVVAWSFFTGEVFGPIRWIGPNRGESDPLLAKQVEAAVAARKARDTDTCAEIRAGLAKWSDQHRPSSDPKLLAMLALGRVRKNPCEVFAKLGEDLHLSVAECLYPPSILPGRSFRSQVAIQVLDRITAALPQTGADAKGGAQGQASAGSSGTAAEPPAKRTRLERDEARAGDDKTH